MAHSMWTIWLFVCDSFSQKKLICIVKKWRSKWNVEWKCVHIHVHVFWLTNKIWLKMTQLNAMGIVWKNHAIRWLEFSLYVKN